jgi:hypothetical protein
VFVVFWYCYFFGNIGKELEIGGFYGTVSLIAILIEIDEPIVFHFYDSRPLGKKAGEWFGDVPVRP